MSSHIPEQNQSQCPHPAIPPHPPPSYRSSQPGHVRFEVRGGREAGEEGGRVEERESREEGEGGREREG